ncbi:hypothetical protein WKW71_05770 [Vibrio alginolyticus]|uniref:hypothetical protein n=1 Tax=Vibrio alginolyticus TaxID=663 RepID=UPI000B262819|nr:hypothetical protein [Vibrio alginolyticus]EJL8713031.1 hypothetical protein [Vibrio alginolyticus]EJS0323128.1 hypothetical protein [Vibrio alginolyticus]ELW1399912.1 hypothetical protein [Vibrio alginolyticus]EMA2427515.1 hypothetical protein [Vibrio alginolyticus]
MRIFISMTLYLSGLLLLSACEQPTDVEKTDCESPDLTQSEGCLWDMGTPTERSQNKGF